MQQKKVRLTLGHRADDCEFRGRFILSSILTAELNPLGFQFSTKVIRIREKGRVRVIGNVSGAPVVVGPVRARRSSRVHVSRHKFG